MTVLKKNLKKINFLSNQNKKTKNEKKETKLD